MIRAKYPSRKPVMVIVDYPIVNEVDRDIPFSGASNLSMLSDLAKAGISQREIYTTYLSYEIPEKESFDWSTEFRKKKNLSEEELSTWFPVEHQKELYMSPMLNEKVEGLLEEIRKVEPRLIVIAGKWSLFFLTGSISYTQTQSSNKSKRPLGGLAKLRASTLGIYEGFNLPEVVVIPILPPVTKQRNPDRIPVMKWDYLKVADVYKDLTENGKDAKYFLEPKMDFHIGTDKDFVVKWLNTLLEELDKGQLLVSVDIETRFNSIIDCIGIAYSNSFGLCIPFSTLSDPNYWSASAEYEIFAVLMKVLKHPNILVTGQNYAYDAQFMWKFWLLKTEAFVDTMILHHTLYNNMEKNLAFLASIYCKHYTYWKDDQKH